MGRASVELVFDNSLGRIGGAWAPYSEISVKRVLTRDGDSNYYINGQHVRRRDVQDIFLGTGLGPRAYSIIEQGMISRVITSKPEELRVFLEEAAGVSKYRERRRETELRLEDTRENLARVGDIQAELTTQLEHLAQQAEVAARYNELQAQLALNHNLLAFTRLREAESASTRYGNEVQKVQVAPRSGDGEAARERARARAAAHAATTKTRTTCRSCRARSTPPMPTCSPSSRRSRSSARTAAAWARSWKPCRAKPSRSSGASPKPRARSDRAEAAIGEARTAIAARETERSQIARGAARCRGSRAESARPMCAPPRPR